MPIAFFELQETVEDEKYSPSISLANHENICQLVLIQWPVFTGRQLKWKVLSLIAFERKKKKDQVKRIGNITQSLFAAKLNPYYQRKWLLLPAKIYELILFLVNLLFSLILHGKYSGYSRFFFPRNSGTMELQKHVESWYLQNNGGKWQNNGKLTKTNPTLFHSLWFSKPQHKQLLTSAKINIES